MRYIRVFLLTTMLFLTIFSIAEEDPTYYLKLSKKALETGDIETAEYLREHYESLKSSQKEKEEMKEIKMREFNAIMTRGEMLSQGYATAGLHSFVILYQKKLYSCNAKLEEGGCVEITKPM